jgi:hypothetical protein
MEVERRNERHPEAGDHSGAHQLRVGRNEISRDADRERSAVRVGEAPLVSVRVVGVGIAVGLTGLMILLFLGSWRSTLIVLISIPLSILTSIVVLYFVGDTLNTMTLGGRRSRSASWSTIRRRRSRTPTGCAAKA